MEQYLKIVSQFQPKSWMIISEDEEYSLVLNNGFHMLTEVFLKQYDPGKATLTKIREVEPDKNIPPDVFIYEHKEIFRVSEKNSIYSLMISKYEKRENNKKRLGEWIRQYEKANGKMNIFYDGPQLRIYQLQREKTKQEIHEDIWGN